MKARKLMGKINQAIPMTVDLPVRIEVEDGDTTYVATLESLSLDGDEDEIVLHGIVVRVEGGDAR